MNVLKFIIYSTVALFLCLSLACSNAPRVENFTSISNYKFSNDKKVFDVDMEDVITQGIIAPTAKQIPSGYFTFNFTTPNHEAGKKLYYKIYYQNESYKNEYFINDLLNPLIEENFYGSWENTNIEFKPVNSINTIDSIRIVGNPRNERKYYGGADSNQYISDAKIHDFVSQIKANPEWLKVIEEKAKANSFTLDQQLYIDASWGLMHNTQAGKSNHRWKRNPRMGKYSAMLIVCTKEDLDKIPDAIKNISHTLNDRYCNPYYYFTHGAGKKLKNTSVIVDSNFITLKCKLNLDKGIYINKSEQQNEVTSKTSYNKNCNESETLFRKAHVQQFFSAIVKDFKMNTIPVIADVINDGYSLQDYLTNEAKYKEEDMIKSYIKNNDCPCKTVKYDSTKKAIQLTIPGQKNIASAAKENVGLRTRVGFTYGKFTAKIKYPELINKDNVWTGLTNAFWMLYQNIAEWNQRRPSLTGYAEKGVYAENAPRTPTTYYSEIDFEMVKTSQFWPTDYYPANNRKVENAQLTDDIVINVTNFDLACKDPKKFAAGIHSLQYDNKQFEYNRWAPWHQALTHRHPEKDDDIFKKDFYYFQIEWQPNEIIWRVGPSKDKMRVVGYMNDQVTMIPNNQMIMIVTQEYHLSHWWPPIPFKQEYIPFNKTDLNAYVYDFEIE